MSQRDRLWLRRAARGQKHERIVCTGCKLVAGRAPRRLTNNAECPGRVVGPRYNFDDRYAQGVGGASAGRGRVSVR
jgi:hypothetical protein